MRISDWSSDVCSSDLERFYLANLLSTPNTSLRIVDPHGKQIANPANVGDREFTAEESGTYLVLIEGRVWTAAATPGKRFTPLRASGALHPAHGRAAVLGRGCKSVSILVVVV